MFPVVAVEYYPYEKYGGVHTVLRMPRRDIMGVSPGVYLGSHIRGVHSASVWMIPTQETFDLLSQPGVIT
jgi:hypothetical protein